MNNFNYLISRISFKPICFLLLLQNRWKVYHFLKKTTPDRRFKIEYRTGLGVIHIDRSRGWKDFLSVYECLYARPCLYVRPCFMCVNMRVQKLFCRTKIPILYNRWSWKSTFVTIRVGLVQLMLSSKMSYVELRSKQNFLLLKSFQHDFGIQFY